MSSASMSLSAFSVSTSTTSESCRSRPSPPPIGDALEGDALALDRLDEVHEGGRAHDGHRFALVAAEVHAPQAAPERLLRQDVALGRIGPQARR